ncbi:hypothetical protein MHM98_11935 [Psychrobium sp. MM17-31]|uniref:hypothetical protein n=1 Tax=Psychrobium sp. MM17-31 TaxID=2917758 RepID=UPI001EF61917|nr:hypothetical protein [Psychrobium sp. MM17-31]MCG7532046.1 hypothetical protein [Psychrobium sp. MM17-31]
MKSMIVLICAFTFLFACTKTKESGFENSIEKIFTANPNADAEKSILNEDFRLIGVYSHKILIPGIDIKCHISPARIRVIDKTSHFYPNYSAAKFNALARVYAKYYNARMASHYRDKGWRICNKK